MIFGMKAPAPAALSASRISEVDTVVSFRQRRGGPGRMPGPFVVRDHLCQEAPAPLRAGGQEFLMAIWWCWLGLLAADRGQRPRDQDLLAVLPQLCRRHLVELLVAPADRQTRCLVDLATGVVLGGVVLVDRTLDALADRRPVALDVGLRLGNARLEPGLGEALDALLLGLGNRGGRLLRGECRLHEPCDALVVGVGPGGVCPRRPRRRGGGRARAGGASRGRPGASRRQSAARPATP